MRNGVKFFCVSMAVLASVLGLPARAEEERVQPTVSQPDPAQLDRDGKRICGYHLMTDSERGGHRAMLHATKSLADRDAVRAEHCKAMRARAEQRGEQLKD
jgi:hypothetical protein